MLGTEDGGMHEMKRIPDAQQVGPKGMIRVVGECGEPHGDV
jgi:hypothetical protein